MGTGEATTGAQVKDFVELMDKVILFKIFNLILCAIQDLISFLAVDHKPYLRWLCLNGAPDHSNKPEKIFECRHDQHT